MKQIRRSVFETNSSSSHSFTFNAKEFKYRPSNIKVPKQHHLIKLGRNEYNWGYEQYSDWYNKADYLSLQASLKSGLMDNYAWNSPREEVILESSYSVEHRNINQVLKKYFPTAKIEHYITGYIDHQSAEDGNKFQTDILSDVQKIEQFIFDPSVTLIISNNNC